VVADPFDPSTGLPKDAPADLRAFLACTGTSVTFKNGPVAWLPLSSIVPDNLKDWVPDAAPSLTVTPGAGATATIGISIGGIPIASVPASISGGALRLDTSNVQVPGVADGLQQAVDNLNAWFNAHGKAISAPTFGNGSVTLAKIEALHVSAPGSVVPDELAGGAVGGAQAASGSPPVGWPDALSDESGVSLREALAAQLAGPPATTPGSTGQVPQAGSASVFLPIVPFAGGLRDGTFAVDAFSLVQRDSDSISIRITISSKDPATVEFPRGLPFLLAPAGGAMPLPTFPLAEGRALVTDLATGSVRPSVPVTVTLPVLNVEPIPSLPKSVLDRLIQLPLATDLDGVHIGVTVAPSPVPADWIAAALPPDPGGFLAKLRPIDASTRFFRLADHGSDANTALSGPDPWAFVDLGQGGTPPRAPSNVPDFTGVIPIPAPFVPPPTTLSGENWLLVKDIPPAAVEHLAPLDLDPRVELDPHDLARALDVGGGSGAEATAPETPGSADEGPTFEPPKSEVGAAGPPPSAASPSYLDVRIESAPEASSLTPSRPSDEAGPAETLDLRFGQIDRPYVPKNDDEPTGGTILLPVEPLPQQPAPPPPAPFMSVFDDAPNAAADVAPDAAQTEAAAATAGVGAAAAPSARRGLPVAGIFAGLALVLAVGVVGALGFMNGGPGASSPPPASNVIGGTVSSEAPLTSGGIPTSPRPISSQVAPPPFVIIGENEISFGQAAGFDP
ncbi:MAG: hypothetical protein L3K06_05700, partial [Thermoplasmata archaeon]|nr:hypothetical protein [Thermoplasmata archaeon]